MKDETFEKYNINQPLWPVFEKKFDFRTLKKRKVLKKILVNERIVEIPFVIKNLGECKKDTAILDVGCMESILPLQLASLGYSVYGIDIRNYSYTHPNFKFIKGDICEYNFGDIKFDVITAISVIEHLGLGGYGDQPHVHEADIVAMRNLHRFLKEDGTLFLTVPFGVPSVNEQQRVYNFERLQKSLCDKFKIHTLEFSAYRENYKGTPFWEMVTLEEAEKIISREKTNAVALCILRKF